MKNSLIIIIFITAQLVFTSAFAHDNLVVIPLRSSEPQALAQLTLSATGSESIVSDTLTLKLKSEGAITETIFTLDANLSSVGHTYKFDQTNSTSFNAATLLASTFLRIITVTV